MDDLFFEDVQHYQEERSMPFVTTPERVGIKKGMLQMIEDSLQAKFGEKGAKLMPEIRELQDTDKYRALNQIVVNAASLEEVRRACAAAATPPEQPKKNARRRR